MKTFVSLLASLMLVSFVFAEELNLTGSWFEPEAPGWGLVIDDAPEATVVYWYDYGKFLSNLNDGAQVWFIAQQLDGNETFTLFRPSGAWNGLQFDVGDPVGTFNIIEATDDTITVDWHFENLATCQPVMVSPVWQGCRGSRVLERLTRNES